MKNLLLTILLTLCFPFTYGVNIPQTIEKANKAYADGHYSAALELYQQVVKEGYQSADLYYNTGNAYFKTNDLPNAILYYERAKRLDPGSEDISFNLKVANSRISDKIESLPEMFYRRWFISLSAQFSSDAWAKAGIVMFILSLLCAATYIISRILIVRKIGFWMTILSFVVSLIFVIFAYQNFQFIQNQNEAIIFAPTVTIKSSPDDKSIDLFVLHEGTKVKLLDHIGNWWEIKIANGSVGWLPSSSIERI